jgi:hypothetical protein
MSNLNKYFGKNLKIKDKDGIEEIPTEEELFMESINLLENCWKRSNSLFENFGINFIDFETDYHQIIENLILIRYGLLKTEIILWYVFGRLNEENEPSPLVLKYDDRDDEKVFINDAKELWDFLNKIEEQNEQ